MNTYPTRLGHTEPVTNCDVDVGGWKYNVWLSKNEKLLTRTFN